MAAAARRPSVVANGDSAIACSRMPPSISRRSRLMASSCARVRRRAGVVGQQAFDAQRHVGQAPGGVDARPQRKAEVEGGGLGGRPAGGENRRQAGGIAPARMRASALRDQAAVVGVERHHVGHGAQRDQGEQGVRARLGWAAS